MAPKLITWTEFKYCVKKYVFPLCSFPSPFAPEWNTTGNIVFKLFPWQMWRPNFNGAVLFWSCCCSYCCLCILIFRPCILNVVCVYLLLSMYSYCSSMYSDCCLCILIVVYVFLFVHVFLTLSMYSYCCLCILIIRPCILIVVYVYLLLSIYSYSSMYS